MRTLYSQKVETRWCVLHDNPIKRGTRRCRACRVDLCLPAPHRRGVDTRLIRPMRTKNQPTKRANEQRANEQRTKGYARA